jgi:hypothetical protein
MSTIGKKFIVLTALAAFGPSALAFDRPEDALTPLRQDQVTASFQRMLAHTPNPAAPAAPADSGRDPLIEALALPVLRWSQASRAQTAPQAAPDASGSQRPDVAAAGPASLDR